MASCQEGSPNEVSLASHSGYGSDDEMTEELFSWLREHRATYPYPWTDPLVIDEINVLRVRVYKDELLDVSKHTVLLETPGQITIEELNPFIGRDKVLSITYLGFHPTPANLDEDSVLQVADSEMSEPFVIKPAPRMAHESCQMCVFLEKRPTSTRRLRDMPARRTRKRGA